MEQSKVKKHSYKTYDLWAHHMIGTLMGLKNQLLKKEESTVLLPEPEGITKYGNGKADDSSQILYRLGMANKWYKRFLAIGAYFDWRLFTPLWVRNWGDRQSLYIEDGNTRSLAYAMRVVCNEEDYKPAPIIWCRSWSHVLSWADNYERDPNADEKYGSHANIDGIKWN